MTINDFGEYTDCFAHIKKSYGGNYCNALNGWYNDPTVENRCKNCPFYKTREQVVKERKLCAKINNVR